MFLVDKKELKTQSYAMKLSEDLAIALQLPIEQSTQIKYRGLVSESDNFSLVTSLVIEVVVKALSIARLDTY